MGWADITGSPGFQFGYPILNALLAASSPAGQRASQGLNLGMHVANQYDQQRQRDEQAAQTRKRLAELFSATAQTAPAATLPGATTNLGLASEEAAGLQGLSNPPEATAATPSMATNVPRPYEIAPETSKPLFDPAHQKLGAALEAMNRPDLAVGLAERMMSRQPEKPHIFGSPETGYYGMGSQDQDPRQLVPGVGRREPTPPRPVFGTQGGEGVSSNYNKETGQWETSRTPLTAAPAHQLSPQDIALKEMQTRLNQVRIGTEGARQEHLGALSARVRQAVATPQGSAAFKEWLAMGGDPGDEEGFLGYIKKKGTATRKPSIMEQLGGQPGVEGSAGVAQPKTLEEYKKLRGGR